MYQYRATVVRVVDGDTVDLAVDLGFRVTFTDRFRLYGIDAPEIRYPTYDAGKAAWLWLTELLPPGTAVTVDTYKQATDKYGRWLATLHLGAVDVNAALVTAGHAVTRTY